MSDWSVPVQQGILCGILQFLFAEYVLGDIRALPEEEVGSGAIPDEDELLEDVDPWIGGGNSILFVYLCSDSHVVVIGDDYEGGESDFQCTIHHALFEAETAWIQVVVGGSMYGRASDSR